ncbi:MAG: metallophosphoesterase [Rhizobiales bacterium]|nr:metallophosphoesterase [Hyphomicrobiales bacterium]
MFRLAHLSDVHLSPLPWGGIGDYMGKRMIGLLSWHLRRRKVHKTHILAKIVADMKAAQADHVAVTGDLVNIALPAEFAHGQRWLDELGAAQTVSFVPGNHDAYVDVAWQDGLAGWQDYMTGDLQLVPATQNCFPYVRQRRNIALIGVSTAVPAALHRASGTLGAEQLAALKKLLEILRERGFCRIVMIHHPPLPGQCVTRKALTDAGDLKSVLETEGAELVLHGHNHMHMRETLQTRHGKSHIIGIPSASAAPGEHKPAAAWYLYTVRRQEKRWQIEVEVRNYDGSSDTIMPETPFKLDCG